MNATTSTADALAETAKLVTRHRWDGRTFAAAVRAWERLRGVEAPAEVRALAVTVGWRHADATPLEVASILRQRAAELAGVPVAPAADDGATRAGAAVLRRVSMDRRRAGLPRFPRPAGGRL